MGEQRNPRDGSVLQFSDQQESCLEYSGGVLDVLVGEDMDFLVSHIRTGTRRTYGSGWCRLHSYCK